MKGNSTVTITQIIQNRGISAVADPGFSGGGGGHQLPNLFFF